MSNNLIDNIIEQNNILSQEELNSLKEYCKIAKFSDGNKDINNFWFNRVEHMSTMPDEIQSILKNIFKQAQEIIVEKYSVKLVNKPLNANIVVWKPAMGMHLHVDDADYKDYNMTAIYYINDNYFGGELNFPTLNYMIKPQENSLIIFPGNENFKHEVKIVINGYRYTSSHWFETDKE